MTEKRVHAFADDVLGDYDAVALADMVRRGEVSPRELAEAAIARVEKVNGALNAVQLADYERALAQAGEKTGQAGGVFAGVPSFIKDNTDLKGLPTRHGSDAVGNTPAAADGEFARQYMSLGFTILGKTTLPEFGFNCSTEYQNREPTRNPWHTDHSPGGSSGGSAALVAAGAVPIAHANDGGGSIRIPAACCGLVGLKPTRGRFVDSKMARSLPVKVVGEGVVTRTVRDTAHFFHGAEQYQRAKKLAPVGLVEGPGNRKLRIGMVIDSITGIPTCPETRATVEETARLLEGMGHRIEIVAAPAAPSFVDDFTDYWGFLAFMVSRFGKHDLGKDFDASRLDDLSKGLAKRFSRRGWRVPMTFYRLQRTRREQQRRLRDFDLVISPVLGHVTPELGYVSPDVPFDELLDRLLKYVSFTPINNANGSPAISLPVGQSEKGLPIGVQLSAHHGDEKTLLEIAYALEQANPWRRIHQAG